MHSNADDKGLKAYAWQHIIPQPGGNGTYSPPTLFQVRLVGGHAGAGVSQNVPMVFLQGFKS
jgi:hypothetical protein